MAKKHDQGGSLWLKLAGDGDKAVVVFLGEPHPREVAFVDGKYVEVDEKMKAAGTKASLRVALNVALYDSKEVKVLEQGVMFFKVLDVNYILALATTTSRHPPPLVVGEERVA